MNKRKRLLTGLAAGLVLATGVVFAAKYTVNTSGTVKNQSGQVLTSPSNTINQNYYNNYGYTY